MIEERNMEILTALLLGLRDEIFERLEDIGQKWSQLDHIENELEAKTAIQELTVDLNHFEYQEMKEIEAIERALGRLKNNSYDVCDSCGGYISKQRLLAIPWTTECMDCATKTKMMSVNIPSLMIE